MIKLHIEIDKFTTMPPSQQSMEPIKTSFGYGCGFEHHDLPHGPNWYLWNSFPQDTQWLLVHSKIQYWITIEKSGKSKILGHRSLSLHWWSHAYTPAVDLLASLPGLFPSNISWYVFPQEIDVNFLGFSVLPRVYSQMDFFLEPHHGSPSVYPAQSSHYISHRFPILNFQACQILFP